MAQWLEWVGTRKAGFGMKQALSCAAPIWQVNSHAATPTPSNNRQTMEKQKEGTIRFNGDPVIFLVSAFILSRCMR